MRERVSTYLVFKLNEPRFNGSWANPGIRVEIGWGRSVARVQIKVSLDFSLSNQKKYYEEVPLLGCGIRYQSRVGSLATLFWK